MNRRLFLAGLGLGMVGCSAGRPLVVDLVRGEDLSIFKLGGLRGVRDGDRLGVRALITDSSSILTMDLQFLIGAPSTELRTGTWAWNRAGARLGGGVMAKSVDFLGGQSGVPSIGGTYELAGPDGRALYRVHFPLTEVKR